MGRSFINESNQSNKWYKTPNIAASTCTEDHKYPDRVLRFLPSSLSALIYREALDATSLHDHKSRAGDKLFSDLVWRNTSRRLVSSPSKCGSKRLPRRRNGRDLGGGIIRMENWNCREKNCAISVFELKNCGDLKHASVASAMTFKHALAASRPKHLSWCCLFLM